MLRILSKVSQISPMVWSILGCNSSHMTLQGTNIYLIGKGSKRIMIDAGEKNFPEFLDNFKKLVLRLQVRIDTVIITHWHSDHTSALSELIPIFKEINNGVLPKVYKFPRLDGVDDRIPTEYSYEKLRNDQVFQLEGVTLRTCYTPGHTTDHAVVQFQQEHAVFCGDCLLGEGTGIFENLVDYMNSLQKIKDMRPKKIFPGHGPVIEDAVKRIDFYIDHLVRREGKLLKLLENVAPTYLSPQEIAQRLYQFEPGGDFERLAITVIKQHLVKLVKEYRVKEQDGKYVYTLMVGG